MPSADRVHGEVSLCDWGVSDILLTGARLNRYGNSRMKPVYDALQEHAGFMRVVFEEINRLIYKPITTGGVLHIKQYRALDSSDNPMLSQMIGIIDLTRGDLSEGREQPE